MTISFSTNSLEENGLTIPQYVLQVEGEEIKEYLHDIYNRMKNSIKSGISTSGKLPGSLGVERKAKEIS